MRYVPAENVSRAARAVNFDGYGNIDVSGSVKGMQKLYGWPKRGQVRVGGYIYNIGPLNVAKLEALNLIRG
jgi:hypothetical protein